MLVEVREAGGHVASKWDELERWMEGQRLPRGFEVLREPDWVEQYVRNMMTKALPEAAGVMIGGGSASFSETRGFVHVKIKLPEGSDLEQLRLLVREDRLRLEGLPGGKAETIKLPKLVRPKWCQALHKNGTLRVKLKKRPTSRTVHEAVIRERP
jgi:HSP20 family molecular chaperone IbpA